MLSLEEGTSGVVWLSGELEGFVEPVIVLMFLRYGCVWTLDFVGFPVLLPSSSDQNLIQLSECENPATAWATIRS
jgi:hypothetical protein